MVPLEKSKSKELFDSKFSSTLTSEYKEMIDSILDRCCGFPLLIIQLAKELSLFEIPENIREQFETFQIPDEYLKFFQNTLKTTSKCVAKLLDRLSQLPVRFEYDCLKCPKQNSRKSIDHNRAKYFIKDTGLLLENEDKTFSLFPIVRKLLSNSQVYNMKPSCSEHLNFTRIVAHIFMDAQKLYRKNKFTDTHNILADQESNIAILFQKVIHSTPGDNSMFQHVFEIAEKAHNVISLSAQQVTQFYQSCYDMSRLFGTPAQQILLQHRIGESCVKYSVCCDLQKGRQVCLSALRNALQLNLNFRCIKICNTLALIFYWEGSFPESNRFCRMAIDMEVNGEGEKQVKYEKIFCQSIEAYTWICQGDINKGAQIAERLLYDGDICGHPTYGIIISTLAWSHFLQGNLSEALKLYERSLKELKKNHLEKNRWIVPMCYKADIQSDLHENHEMGLKIISDAEKIQREFCLKHVNIARILLVHAKIILRMGKLDSAIEKLQTAAKYLTDLGSNHYYLLDIQVLLAHCYLINKEKQLAEKAFMESRKLRNKIKHPIKNCYKTIISEHLKFISECQNSCLNVIGCNFCKDITEHNRQPKSPAEEEEKEVNNDKEEENLCLRNGMKEESLSKSLKECRYPQPESGCG